MKSPQVNHWHFWSRNPGQSWRLYPVLLASLKDADSVEVPPDVPGDAWDEDAEEQDEDGGENGEVTVNDVPTDSVPTTDLDPEDPTLDDQSDSEVEVVDLDPYWNQPDNQLGLEDYESPRHVSETPVFTPEREEPKVTPGLRKAAHLNPEDLRDDDSCLGSGGGPSPSSEHSGAIDLDKDVVLFECNDFGIMMDYDVEWCLYHLIPLLAAGACDANQREIQAIIQELQRPGGMCDHNSDQSSILWPIDTPLQAWGATKTKGGSREARLGCGMDGTRVAKENHLLITVCNFESKVLLNDMLPILYFLTVCLFHVNCCSAAGVMIIPDSLPVGINMDVCDTVPMFEEPDVPGSPKDSPVFTSGSNSSDAPMAPSVNDDHADGNEKQSDSLQPPVKKPRVLPPVPAFQPSKPDESDVP